MTETPQTTPVPLEETLDGTLGFEVLEIGEDRARGRVAVERRVKQPMGLVHGGVYAAFAESLASAAPWLAVREAGDGAMGLSNQPSFLRPVSAGFVHAEARRRHRGRSTWIWDVEFTDDEAHVCALARITIAVRPAR